MWGWLKNLLFPSEDRDKPERTPDPHLLHSYTLGQPGEKKVDPKVKDLYISSLQERIAQQDELISSLRKTLTDLQVLQKQRAEEIHQLNTKLHDGTSKEAVYADLAQELDMLPRIRNLPPELQYMNQAVPPGPPTRWQCAALFLEAKKALDDQKALLVKLSDDIARQKQQLIEMSAARRVPVRGIGELGPSGFVVPKIPDRGVQ